MTSQEIYEVMESHWATFKENHDRFTDKKVKQVNTLKVEGLGEVTSQIFNLSFILGVISLERVKITSLKTDINLRQNYNKLDCKGKV